MSEQFETTAMRGARLFPVGVAKLKELRVESGNQEARKELDEVCELIRAVNMFADNYMSCARSTGDEAIARKARARLEEALLECSRQAIAELHSTTAQPSP